MTKTTQYKNTPIGPIPTEWEVKKLGEVAKFINGKAYKQEELLNEGKYRVLRVGNLNTSTEWYWSDLELDEDKYVNNGDLMYAWSASFGPSFWEQEKTIYHYHIWKVLPILTDKSFLYQHLLFDTDKMLLLKQGGTMFHITKSFIEDRFFPLPPLPEQQKIAEVLSTWDKAIQDTDTIIKKLQDRNKALAFSLLTGKKRVKGFEDKWDNYKLDHFLEEYSSKPNGEIDLPVFTSSKNGLMSQSDYYSGGRISSRENVDYNIIPDGYITYRSRSDDGLFTFNKNTTGYDGLISGYYPVFKVINGNDNFFLYYLNFFKTKLTKYSTGTSQLVLSFKALKSATFYLPSLEEQNAIAEILNTANQEVKQYQQKLEALKLQKKGLMQQLLTGKVRTV